MSIDFSPDSLRKTVTKRYVIALSIIATLSMLAFYMLFLVLKDSGEYRLRRQYIGQTEDALAAYRP